VIRRNVELEARLIDDLLDLTRIVQGKLELKPEVADLRAILEHALDACCPPGTFFRSRFRVETAPGDHRLWGDAPRLTQVFWNLFKNALKFTPEGGHIEVRTRRGDDGRTLVAEVSDEGIGIESERLGQIFDAFEQGQRAITRRYGGLGLGLTISKSIVDLHQGRLTASSAGSGKGATFRVELPIGAAQEEPAAQGEPAGELAAAAEETRPLHILLVEDHPDTSEAMAALLSLLGHEVAVAGDAEQALRAAQAAAQAADGFDLVISDVGLPGTDGLELMRELRRRHHLTGIALSGYGMDEDVRKSLAAGFSQHLTKPVNLPTLKAAIARAAASGSAPEKETHGSRDRA
jgi:two-component system CheB/CheR fusion protein